MVQTVKLKLINEKLHIGMVNWREVYIYSPKQIKLTPEVDRGRLVYRAKGSKRRISYKAIKKGLIKKEYLIKEEVPDWWK